METWLIILLIVLAIIILGLIIYFVSKKTKQSTEISVEEISSVKEIKEIIGYKKDLRESIYKNII